MMPGYVRAVAASLCCSGGRAVPTAGRCHLQLQHHRWLGCGNSTAGAAVQAQEQGHLRVLWSGAVCTAAHVEATVVLHVAEAAAATTHARVHARHSGLSCAPSPES